MLYLYKVKMIKNNGIRMIHREQNYIDFLYGIRLL